MTRLATTVAATAASLIPAVALAADGKESPGLVALTLQMVASLAVVLGLIYLFYHLSNRWFKLGAQTRGSSERHIRLVETRYLAPKKSLVLVEVGGEFLLLGSSGDALTFIKQIDILEEIEVVDDAEKRPMAALFQGKLDAMAAKIAAMKQGRADSPGQRAEKL